MFKKDLPGSNFLHWGAGELSISARRVSFTGELAPGPDWHFARRMFLPSKEDSAYIGEVKTFDNFILSIPVNINPANHTAVLVWCETFGELITAAANQ